MITEMFNSFLPNDCYLLKGNSMPQAILKLLPFVECKYEVLHCVMLFYTLYQFLTGLLLQSLCAQFAIEGLPINQLYGSDSLEAAEREIQYFFPPQHTVALIKPHVTQEQRGKYINIEPMYMFFFKSCEILQSKEKLKE